MVLFIFTFPPNLSRFLANAERLTQNKTNKRTTERGAFGMFVRSFVLLRAEDSVAGVAEAWQDVILLVQALVE